MKFLALLAFLFTTPAFAGQALKVKSVGFSKDGAYYAFVQYGTSDGSGSAISFGYVVDVKNNKWVKTSKFFESDVDEPVPGDENNAIVKAIEGLNLKKYKISPFANLGEDLLVRTLSDKSEYVDTTFAVSGEAEGGAGPIYRRYSLESQTSPAPAEKYDTSFCYAGRELLKLTLKGEDKGSGALTKVLQDDKRLPESRGCATGYAVRRVTVYGDSLVVIVSYSSPGFEGPDVNNLAITATVELPAVN